jgi:hypothetical protein
LRNYRDYGLKVEREDRTWIVRNPLGVPIYQGRTRKEAEEIFGEIGWSPLTSFSDQGKDMQPGVWYILEKERNPDLPYPGVYVLPPVGIPQFAGKVFSGPRTAPRTPPTGSGRLLTPNCCLAGVAACAHTSP